MGGSKRKRSDEPERLFQRNGVWYARVSVDGRDQRQSLKTRDRREAERRLAPFLAGKSPYHGTVRNTFRDAAALWFKAGQWKPKTEAGYAKLLLVLDRHFGEMFWDQVDKPALQAFADRMRQPSPPSRMKGAGTATINRYLSVISGIADHVRELPGWPEINPVRLLPKKPRRERRLPYVRPSANDVERVVGRPKKAFGDLCRFALLTGARKDEIATLMMHDAQGGKAQFWDTKNKRVRVIPLTPQADAIVARQPRHASGLLFVTRDGGPYRRVTEMWRETMLAAQKAAHAEGLRIPRLRFHDLRHEYAIRYLENGGSLYTLQQLLGHGSIRQTEAYLRYLTPDQAARAMQGTAQNTALPQRFAEAENGEK